MKSFIFLTILAAAAIPHTVSTGLDAGSASGNLVFSHPPYGCFGYPGFPPVIQISGEGVGQVLASITRTEKRQGLAEQWFQILEQSCTRSLDLQKGWLQVQQRHLELQKQIEEIRLETLKLQAEIEKLQREKLRLEKEKLELQLKLQKETGSQAAGPSVSGSK